MTEQAKPTPGPWHVYGRTNGLQIAVVGPSNSREESITYVWGQNGEAEANARLIAEAGTVHHEIGLTPRQLAEQRAELLEIADAAVRALASDICNLVPDEDLQRWQAAIAEIKGVLGDD